MAISDLDYADDSDVALIRRTRAGDHDAYGLLHVRHAGSARALAWRMSRSVADADDLVAEGFARVLAALQRGSGPEVAFRPYLLSTIRRLAYDRTDREKREAPVEYDLDEPTTPHVDPVVEGFERDTAAAAFASLPERWRMVLWHTEVEGQSPAQVAELLGIKPNAVAALAYRAREGLRQAYLGQHAPNGGADSRECRTTRDRLAAYVRDGLTPAQSTQVADHLESCDECRAAYLELASVNTSLRSVVAVALLGPAGVAYLAELHLPTIGAAAVGSGAASASGSGATGSAGTGPGATGAAAGAPAAGSGAAKGGAGAAASRQARRAASRGRVVAVAAALVAVAVVTGVLVARRPEHRLDTGQRADAVSQPTAAGGPGHRDAATTAPSDADVATAPTPSTEVPAPGRPSGGAAPTSSSAPARSPGSTAPAPPTTAPPGTRTPTGPATTLAPPATVPPPTTPPTTIPIPVERSRLTMVVTSAGGLVAGRPGVLVATVANQGPGVARQVEAVIDLRDMVLRGLPHLPGGPSSRAVGGSWDCVATSPQRLTCTVDELAPGASTTLYVPVQVTSAAATVAVGRSVQGIDNQVDLTTPPSVPLPVSATGMAARYATVDHAAVATAGNVLLSCPDAAIGCADARAGLGPDRTNGDFAMAPVDVDGDPATTNSSSAPLLLPSCSSVLSAQLYWGGTLDPGVGGAPAPAPGAVDQGVLRSPGGLVSTIAAERVDRTASGYQAVADVTDAVAQGGAGSWTFGGAQLATGVNTFGGWSLVVVCADPAAPLRSVVVLDGLSEVTATPRPTDTFSVGGFVVPSTGASATVDVVTYEGDRGLTGDQLTVGGRAITDAANPAGDSFNSSAAVLGRSVDGLVPAARNLLGLDLDRFDVSGVLPAGATSTTIGLTSTADVYLPGVVAISVDQ
ncbi:sigma-70 family RNA polymerase sigma factor [Aquihabitans sp. G128]|uniref:sigma-70 family RNA polymerase sigma factor n=1 Tax=Aquihabitans sp. G128 TaxID=2849779 RepID=UPI001C214908|nr:sigma-70 family RNA polymerase sigma factor [Aquihabitans sp. G128]QXC59709.1 sigma-70 family RNA polymerase sigma factor [Aquihabitans sp. G128]